jgi:6-pyruvoyltetrahydropterin/6-carboxytetrahydropterin synthase
MYKIGKTYHFSAAHTIPGHPKCGRVHGHNYEVTIILSGDKLDDMGMLVDYSEMDRLIKPTIDAMDHKFLLPERAHVPIGIGESEFYILDVGYSTAEAIAEYLWTMFFSVFRVEYNLELEVTVCETQKTFATYSK